MIFLKLIVEFIEKQWIEIYNKSGDDEREQEQCLTKHRDINIPNFSLCQTKKPDPSPMAVLQIVEEHFRKEVTFRQSMKSMREKMSTEKGKGETETSVRRYEIIEKKVLQLM